MPIGIIFFEQTICIASCKVYLTKRLMVWTLQPRTFLQNWTAIIINNYVLLIMYFVCIFSGRSHNYWSKPDALEYVYMYYLLIWSWHDLYRYKQKLIGKPRHFVKCLQKQIVSQFYILQFFSTMNMCVHNVPCSLRTAVGCVTFIYGHALHLYNNLKCILQNGS